MLNETEAWAGGQVVLEQFDVRRRAFGERLYAAIIQVLHIADHLMPRGRALGKEAIADALNFAADQESTSYHRELLKLLISSHSTAFEDSSSSTEGKVERPDRFLLTRQRHRQRHLLPVGPAGIARGLAGRLFIIAHRPGMFGRMRALKTKTSPTVDHQWAINLSVCAIIFDRRRRIAYRESYVRATPGPLSQSAMLTTAGGGR